MKYKKNEKIVLRKTGQFYFLIDPCKSYNDENEDIFQTDEIGVAIWNCIDNMTTYEAVFSKFVALLNDDITNDLKKQINNDLSSFVEQLEKNNFITEV